MKEELFEKVIKGFIDYEILNRLERKGEEYADVCDRFHNFNAASELTGFPPHQVLGLFMAKHIISIYDMMRDEILLSEKNNLDMWKEKIGDAICYLLLLYGMVVDAEEKYKPVNYGAYTCDECGKPYIDIQNSHDCDK